jgi:lipopolysaccharide transport system ATP-binding protein
MSDAIIKVEGLGKKYLLKHQATGRPRYVALRDVLADKAKSLFKNRRAEAGNQKSVEEFWALKDVSFEVKRGEAVGIIGRNGAGKSTLLKLLSRITEPTTGCIRLRGRVASLLEVGTGFHPELTGRENIFLNGAVLGMARTEIKKKFDEIVAFAEVEKFLDTPVKRYSSGMYMRLAFAVAAHLEPEILIVDEVLAVGDASFQKKCLGKMQDVSGKDGRTVIFVSHNIGAITQLCSHAILLSHGQIVSSGETTKVTARYLDSSDKQWSEKNWDDNHLAPGDDSVKLKKVRVIDENFVTVSENVDVRRRIGVQIQYQVLKEGVIFVPSLHLHNAEGIQIFLAIDLEENWVSAPRRRGFYQSTAWIPGNFLNIGIHYVSVALSRLDINILHLFEQQVIAFNVAESSENDTARGIYAHALPGVIRPILDWQTVVLDSINP